MNTERIKDILAFLVLLLIIWFIIFVVCIPYMIAVYSITQDLRIVNALAVSLLFAALMLNMFIWNLIDE